VIEKIRLSGLNKSDKFKVGDDGLLVTYDSLFSRVMNALRWNYNSNNVVMKPILMRLQVHSGGIG